MRFDSRSSYSEASWPVVNVLDPRASSTPTSSNSSRAAQLIIAARPRIAAHVITDLFPETGLVFGEKAHALDPLRGFPRIELRNDQTHRAAVLGRNRRAVMQESEERILIQEVFDGNVGGPA